MTKHTRRAGIAATLLATALLLSACQNLPRRAAGTKCKTVGEHAQDGTWVLQCGSNKRWNQLMTIAAANDAVANWLRSQVPPPTAPPATTPVTAPPTTTMPSAPALTSFPFATNALISTESGHIAPGIYSTVVPSGAACLIEVTGAPSRRVRGNTGGPLYMSLYAGMRVTTGGPCFWSQAPLGAQTMPASGNGMYRTGIEIQPGLYTAPGGTQCYWETSTNADGSLESVTDIYFGKGPQLALVEAGDAYFTSDGCGTWTPLPSVPTRYLNVVSSIDNDVLRGLRAFYQGGQFTTQIGPGHFDLDTAEFSVSLMPNDPFAEGTFNITRGGNPINVNLLSGGRGCQIITGTATISDLVLAGDGTPTSMHLVVIGQCDGESFGYDTRF